MRMNGETEAFVVGAPFKGIQVCLERANFPKQSDAALVSGLSAADAASPKQHHGQSHAQHPYMGQPYRPEMCKVSGPAPLI